MPLPATAFHQAILADNDSSCRTFGYGTAWCRWLRSGDKIGLVIVANAPPLTNLSRWRLSPASDEAIILTDPSWPCELAFPIDPAAPPAPSMSVSLRSESDPAAAYARSRRALSPLVLKEMREEGDPSKNVDDRLDILIRHGELSHADACLIDAGQGGPRPEFVTVLQSEAQI